MEEETQTRKSELLSSDASIVHCVNQILLDAINKKASDVHLEPYTDYYRLRFRIDGVLQLVTNYALSVAVRIILRIKVISDLDIAEKRLPQDGRFNITKSTNNLVDARVSICPTVNGEKVVVRILDQNVLKLDIKELGFYHEQYTVFLHALNKPQGLILVTGPTGSGKTATLYSGLAILNTAEKNIITVEDPVEIKLPGINQVNVNSKIGLTFAQTLRAFLRQDPDIIMIGEIRDLETAEIAVAAAQTGHLVLATLHTNSAAATIVRLLQMGVPAFQIVNSVTLIVAQRLVRKYDGNRYNGRLGVFEVMPISTKLSQAIMSHNTSREIAKYAEQEGMRTIQQSCLNRVQEGLTTIEEMQRVMCNENHAMV